MAITVKVVPDFSAFAELAAAVGCDEATALAVTKSYTLFPKPAE